MWCWEQNLDRLEELTLLLTTEPTLALGVEFLTHKLWGTHQIKAMYERKIFGTIPFISLSRDSETSVKQHKVFSQLAAGPDSSMD